MSLTAREHSPDPLAPPTDLAGCPYVGLVPFRDSDEPYFFGRDRERDLIAANLAASRLTILYAASGVGKSSVLRAGVLPLARRSSAEMYEDLGTPGIATAYVRHWSSDATGAIAESVIAAVTEAPGAGSVPGAPPALLDPEWFRAVLAESGCAGVHLILDQFEEYFIYHPDEPAQGGMVEALAGLLSDPRLPVNVLLAVREDALASLDRFKGRIPHLFKNFLRLAPLTTASAREAVVRPLEVHNTRARADHRMSLEPELIEVLLDQVREGRIEATSTDAPATASASGPQSDTIQTPYLQLVLIRLWGAERAMGSSVLRRSTLEGLGGAQTIVRRHLDDVMEALPPAQLDVAAAVFRHLVTPSGSKIALAAADLADWSGKPLDQVQQLLGSLSAGEQRILRPVPPPRGITGATRYEIYHDVLGAAVIDWRNRYVAEKDRISAAARLVQEREEARTEAASAQSRLRRARLVALGLILMLVGVGALGVWALDQRRSAVEAAAEAQEGEVLLGAAGLLTSDPTESLRTAVAADEEYHDAKTEEAVLKASGAPRYTLITDPGWCVGAESPCGADRILVTADGMRFVVLDNSGQSPRLMAGDVEDVANGRWVQAVLPWEQVPAAQASPAALTAPAARAAPAPLPPPPPVAPVPPVPPVESLPESVQLYEASVSQDGDLVAMTTWSGRGFVVDAHTGETIELDLDDEQELWLSDVAFLSGSAANLVAVTTPPVGIAIFDASTGERVGELDVAGPAATTPLGGDGLAGIDSGDRRFKLWVADAPLPTLESAPIPDEVNLDGTVHIAASDRSVIAVVGELNEEMMLIVWDLTEGSQVAVHGGPRQKVIYDLTIDESGRFATVAVDKTARQFDLREGVWRPSLPQHSGWVVSAFATRGGKRMISGGADGRIFYWSTEPRPGSVSVASDPVYELLGHAGGIQDLVPVGPDRRSLVSLGADRTARIWRLPDTRRYEQHRDWVIGLETAEVQTCLSSGVPEVSDECLVTVSSDRAALHRLALDTSGATEQIDFQTEGVLEPPSGKLLRQVLPRMSGGERQALVLYEESGTPELWRWGADGQAELVRVFAPIPDNQSAQALSASHDGSFVVAGDSQGKLHVWDVETGERVEYDIGEAWGSNLSVTFDPTGAWLALTSESGVRIAWFESEGDFLDLPCPTPDPTCTRGAVHVVASRDGRRLAVSNDRGDIHVWGTDRELLAGPLSSSGVGLGRPALSADGRMLAVGNHDGLIQVWDVDTGFVVFQVRRHSDTVNAVAFAGGPDAGSDSGAGGRESLLISVSDDTTAAAIECPPCADAETAVADARQWVAAHPGEGTAQ